MKYLHIFAHDDKNKFSKPFINFIDSNFNQEEHTFVLSKSNSEDLSTENSNIGSYSCSFWGIIEFISEAKKSDKVFFHQLPHKYIMLGLFFSPKILNKSYWCIWGGDLYHYKFRSKSIKSNIKEILRKFVIKKIYGLITQLKGDYEFSKQWYGAKGRYYYSFMYPSNLYKEYDFRKLKKATNKIYILVGNSACETNEHLEVLEKLAKYKDKNIQIICPLSYSGNEIYVQQVVEAGYNIIGKEKFTPILDFMQVDNYLELLAKIDVAIFNHKRQRGLGNITSLLGFGKKVYIREEITTWQFCIDHNLKVYSANGNYDDLFEKMPDKIRRNNIQSMKICFSKKKLVDDWRKIFTELIENNNNT